MNREKILLPDMNSVERTKIKRAAEPECLHLPIFFDDNAK